jgi:hypothetical protein
LKGCGLMVWLKLRRLLSTVVAVGVVAAAVAVVQVVETQGSLQAAGTCAGTATRWTQGDGSSASPFQIQTADHLLYLSSTSAKPDWDKHFVQTADIDLTGCDWTPIGWIRQPWTDSTHAFTGHYDGGGMKISKVSVDMNEDYLGLFGVVRGGSFARMEIDIKIRAASNGWSVGGLIGMIYSPDPVTITDVSATVDVDVAGSNVGGLVGDTYDNGLVATISDVTISGSVEADGGQLGGVIGAGFAGFQITNADVTASLDGSGLVGGLVGWAGSTHSTISAATFSGTVAGAADFVGGLVGYVRSYPADQTLNIVNSVAQATVSGANNVGGIIGNVEVLCHTNEGGCLVGAVYVTDSQASGSVTATGNNAGGLVGAVQTGALVVSGSSSTSDVTAADNVGGAIGAVREAKGCHTPGMQPQNCWTWDAQVDLSGVSVAADLVGTGSAANVGGVVGLQDERAGLLALRDMSVDVDIKVDEHGRVGGVIGRARSEVVIEDVVASVAIDVTNEGSFGGVGGLIGQAAGALSVSRAAVLGSIVTREGSGSTWAVGGFAGELAPQSAEVRISEVAAVVDISGVSQHAGGLVAEISGSALDMVISDSYAAGDVSSTDASAKAGGLIGNVNATGFGFSPGALTVSDSYAVGMVTATGSNATAGGLIGVTSGTVTVSASYFDADTTGLSVSAGGTGLSTVAMQTLATFVDAGWDISSSGAGRVWVACDGVYPALMWTDAGRAASAVCAPPAPVVTTPPTTSTPPTTVPPTTVPPTPAPLPVPTGGVLPALQPGVSQVLVDGVPVSVEVFVEASTDLVMKGDGFELRLAGECSAGCSITTTADGRQVLELEERGLAKVSGEGFLAGTPVYVWLFSEPRFLGELTVNADGTFTGSVPLGDIAPGEHTLQVNGISFDGLPRTANLGVVVNALPASTTLPATGSDPLGVWVLALALLGLGVILTVRRKPYLHA